MHLIISKATYSTKKTWDGGTYIILLNFLFCLNLKIWKFTVYQPNKAWKHYKRRKLSIVLQYSKAHCINMVGIPFNVNCDIV